MSDILELHNDDCLNVFKFIPDQSIDLVVTDCPYKIVQGGVTNLKGGIFKTQEIKTGKVFGNNSIEFNQWLPEVFRVLKQGTHCYIMVNARNLTRLQCAAEQAGFQFVNILIWEKNNVTPNRYYMQQAEYILLLRKGPARTINNPGTSNVLKVPNIIGRKVHPTEKPVELMKILIENSSQPGDTVLDPFMGSGSTGVACIENDRKFIGIEIDKKYFDIANGRCKASSLLGQIFF